MNSNLLSLKKNIGILFGFMLCACPFSLFAQLQLKVSVVNPQNAASANVKVWLREENTGAVLEKRTDSYGRLSFEVPSGTWMLNLAGMPNYKEYVIPENTRGESNFEIMYDEREMMEEEAFINQRKITTFTEEKQNNIKVSAPKQGCAILKISLVTSKGVGVRPTTVKLVSIKQKKIYVSETVGSSVVFEVPANDFYAVDIDEIQNFTFNRRMREGAAYTLRLNYDYSTVVEKDFRDTIVQTLPYKPTASDSRALSNIYVYDAQKNPRENEWVYLASIYKSKVYKAQTNKDGLAQFLLPIGDKYMIHFTYKKDVDVISLHKVHGKHTGTNRFTYEPEPKLASPQTYIPSPQDLYLESFTQFFTKTITPPQKGFVGLSLEWLSGLVNAQSREAVLQIGVSMKSDTSVWKQSPPVNLMFVLDRSGSMAGYDRIETLKSSMVEFAKKFRAGDKVGLISFCDAFSVEYPLQLVTKSKEEFVKRVMLLEAGGGTHIESGLMAGYEELYKNYNPQASNLLLLLSDGYGDDEPAKLVEKSVLYNKKGIDISTIGVGSDYNASLLSLLANQGGGTLDQVKDAKMMSESFTDEISSKLCLIGRNAKLKISYNPKIEYNNIYGFAIESKESDAAIIPIGNLYGRANKICLAQFQLNKPGKEIENESVKIEVSYLNCLTNKTETITEYARLQWDDATGNVKLQADAEIKKMYAVAIANQSIKVMVEAYAAKNYEKANATLTRAFEQLKELYGNMEDADIDRLVSEMQTYSKHLVSLLKK